MWDVQLLGWCSHPWLHTTLGFFSVLVLIWAVQGKQPMVNPSQWHAVCYGLGGELFWFCLRCANCRWHSAHCQGHHQGTSGGKRPSLKSSPCVLLSYERGLWTLLQAEAGRGAGLHSQQSHLVQATFSKKPPRADSFMEYPCCYQWRQSQDHILDSSRSEKRDGWQDWEREHQPYNGSSQSLLASLRAEHGEGRTPAICCFFVPVRQLWWG